LSAKLKPLKRNAKRTFKRCTRIARSKNKDIRKQLNRYSVNGRTEVRACREKMVSILIKIRNNISQNLTYMPNDI
jgi:hypothetical protein